MTDKKVTTADIGKRLKTFYENFDFFENFVIKPITDVANNTDFQNFVVGVKNWVDVSKNLIKNIDSAVNTTIVNPSKNAIITSYTYNGYTASVFEVDINNDATYASITIGFNTIVTNATIIIVGGGGGGGYSAGGGGGGGGGGTTVLTNQTFNDLNQGIMYDIVVGNGGKGAISGSSNGASGNSSSFSRDTSNTIYTSSGGGGGSSSSAGAGGNINSEIGGGGGGGGCGGNDITGGGGAGGSNPSGSYIGSNGSGVQYMSGESGVDGYNYGGVGGSSYNSLNNIPILTPFISSSSSILVGGGGAGGGSGESVTPNNIGGYAGNGVGGIYGYPENYGETSTSSISTGYGNGGGGSGGYGNGGAGGAGVVIIYWKTLIERIETVV